MAESKRTKWTKNNHFSAYLGDHLPGVLRPVGHQLRADHLANRGEDHRPRAVSRKGRQVGRLEIRLCRTGRPVEGRAGRRILRVGESRPVGVLLRIRA